MRSLGLIQFCSFAGQGTVWRQAGIKAGTLSLLMHLDLPFCSRRLRWCTGSELFPSARSLQPLCHIQGRPQNHGVLPTHSNSAKHAKEVCITLHKYRFMFLVHQLPKFLLLCGNLEFLPLCTSM